MDATTLSLQTVGAALAALSALATAAFGLLDASKAFWGGPSNIGQTHIKRALAPFAPAMAAAVGEDRWWPMVRANWLNGMAKADQKAAAANLVKLGLSPGTAEALALAGHVDPEALRGVARALVDGEPLTDQQLNVIGRLDAVLGLTLDAAYERAEQQYRNWARLLAGLVAMGLSLVAAWALDPAKPSWMFAAVVGLLAVPMAPLAKDLTSALSTAARALKAARAV